VQQEKRNVQFDLYLYISLIFVKARKHPKKIFKLDEAAGFIFVDIRYTWTV